MEPQELLEGESELSPFRMDDVEHELLAANFDVARGEPEIRAASISILKSRLQNDYGGHRALGQLAGAMSSIGLLPLTTYNSIRSISDFTSNKEFAALAAAVTAALQEAPIAVLRQLAQEGFSERERPMMQFSSGGCDGERSSIRPAAARGLDPTAAKSLAQQQLSRTKAGR